MITTRASLTSGHAAGLDPFISCVVENPNTNELLWNRLWSRWWETQFTEDAVLPRLE